MFEVCACKSGTIQGLKPSEGSKKTSIMDFGEQLDQRKFVGRSLAVGSAEFTNLESGILIRLWVGKVIKTGKNTSVAATYENML